MKTHYLHKSLLLLFFFSISFKTFCQFGERQVLHEDGEEIEYSYMGVFDFDNNSINEPWYSKKTENSFSHVFFVKNEAEFEEIEINDSEDWIDWRGYVVEDINNDDLNDIIHRKDGQLYLLINENNFQFSLPRELPLESSVPQSYDFSFADIDDDGSKDLIISGFEYLKWYRNIGGGNFADSQDLDINTIITGQILVEDLDSDGIKEIIVPALYDINIFSKSENGYSLKESLPITNGEVTEVYVEDFNNDNLPDIVAETSQDEEKFLIIYENGATSFNQGIIIYEGYSIINVVPDDVNDDGFNDLLLTVYSDFNFLDEINGSRKYFSGLLWLENTGGNSFVLHPVVEFVNGDIKDVDSDGKLDIVRPDDLEWVNVLDYENKIYQYNLLKEDTYLGEVFDLEALRVDGSIRIYSVFENSLYGYQNLLNQPTRRLIKSNLFLPFSSGLLEIADIGSNNQDLVFGYHEYLTFDSDIGVRIEYLKYEHDYKSYKVNSEVQYDDYSGVTSLHSNFLNDDDLPDLVFNNENFGEANIFEKGETNYQLTSTLNLEYINDVTSRSESDLPKLLTIDRIYNYENSEINLVTEKGGREFIDFDGDGDLDIISLKEINSFEFTESYWYENLGNDTYSNKLILNLEVERTYPSKSYLLIDLDMDGDADFITSSGDELSWQENLDNKGSFSEKKLIDTVTSTVIRSEDLDQDGDQDLIIGGEGFIYWYENKIQDGIPTSLSISLSSAEALQGDVVEIPVIAGNFDALQSLSFSIQWDKKIASFEEVTQFGLEGMSQESFFTDEVKKGQLGFNWSINEGVDISDDKTLFVLRLKLIGNENQSTNLKFCNEPVIMEARNALGQMISINTTAGIVSIKESAAPNDITLNNTKIKENQPPGTLICSFSSKDEDNTEGFTYSLVEGEGDEGNSFFEIKNTNQLVSSVVFDFETKETYSIRIQSTDSRGKSFQKVFQIIVTDVDENNNQAPTGIALSANSIDENLEAGTLVGILSTTDEDEDDEHRYRLVEGEGSSGNDFFTIRDNELLSLEQFDFEEQESYSIRIQTDDGKGGTFCKAFIIKITDVDEVIKNCAPVVNNSLSDQNLTIGKAFVFTFPANTFKDNDEGDKLTYTVTLGNGNPLPDWLSFDDEAMKLSGTPDAPGNVSIRVTVTDQKEATASDEFILIIEEEVMEVSEEMSKLYKIYPNPIDSYLMIENQDKTDLIKYCRIIDYTGRIVKEWENNAVNDLQVDMKALKSGTYVLELVSANETLRTHVLKK